jgi:hypothetical protein
MKTKKIFTMQPRIGAFYVKLIFSKLLCLLIIPLLFGEIRMIKNLENNYNAAKKLGLV